MQIERRRLMVLLNALYDQGVESIPVKHPCEDIGELVRIELEDDGQATVRFTQGTMTYQDNREGIPARHGQPAYEDLPDATKQYLSRIEALTETPIDIISVGPGRNETIMINNAFS